MDENDERLLQLDVDNLVGDMQRLLNAQARIEAKIDAVLEGFRLLGQAEEEAGGRLSSAFSDADDYLEKRLEEIARKEDRCEN